MTGDLLFVLQFVLGVVAGWFWRQARFHQNMANFHSGQAAFLDRAAVEANQPERW